MDMDKFQEKFVTKSKILRRNISVSTDHNHYKKSTTFKWCF